MKILIIGAIIVFIGFCFAVGRAYKLTEQIDLPEELNQISKDSLNPTPLFGWQDSITGQKHIEMRNYEKRHDRKGINQFDKD